MRRSRAMVQVWRLVDSLVVSPRRESSRIVLCRLFASWCQPTEEYSAMSLESWARVVACLGLSARLVSSMGSAWTSKSMAPLAACGAVFGVAELFGADRGAVDGGAVFAPDAEGGVVPGCAWVVEEWDEAVAFDLRRDIKAREFGNGAVDVERLRRCGCRSGRCRWRRACG